MLVHCTFTSKPVAFQLRFLRPSSVQSDVLIHSGCSTTDRIATSASGTGLLLQPSQIKLQ